MKTRFETETCSRCHGSGQYSYCERFGTRCFKCTGTGWVLTKRGRAARDFLEQLSTIPVEDLKIGDRISVDSITHGGQVFTYIASVTEITKDEGKRWHVTTNHPKFGKSGVIGKTKFRIYGPENEARIQQALAYQETLTKAGTVRKQRGGVK